MGQQHLQPAGVEEEPLLVAVLLALPCYAENQLELVGFHMREYLQRHMGFLWKKKKNVLYLMHEIPSSMRYRSIRLRL